MSPLECATTEELIRELVARHNWLVVGGTLKQSPDDRIERVTMIVHGSTHGCVGSVRMLDMATNQVMAGHIARLRPFPQPGGDDADGAG